MRKLKTSDIPAFCRLMKTIGIKEEIKKIAQEDKTVSDWDRGFDVFYNIFDLITEKKGEHELYVFLSGIFECTAKDIEDMEISVFFENCETMIKENDLKGFFMSVLKLMSTN